jgi:ubiquinone/menaquinone biosynthesis C-methylase UbiE
MPVRRRCIDNVWDVASEGWADFVRTGKDYFRDSLNNPATFRLIGSVKGKKVLDLACGEGYNTRILARKGAKVVGVDSSKRLTDLAETEERRSKLGIQYYRMHASCLKGISNDFFDLVTCFMALHDIENYQGAVSEVARVLKRGGRFVFSIPHPCFEKFVVKGVRINAAERYFEKIEYPIEWNMERLRKHFRTVSFHRTLTDYSLALAKSGLFISRLVEPRPSREAVGKHPSLRDELIRPQSIIFESTKRGTNR